MSCKTQFKIEFLKLGIGNRKMTGIVRETNKSISLLYICLGVQNLKILISDLDLCALLKYTSMLVAAYCIARLFSFVMTNGPTTKETGSEDLLEVVYHKVRSPCISQGCQVGHNWCEFKIFSLQVLRNVLLKNKYLLWYISLKSNCWYKFEMP